MTIDVFDGPEAVAVAAARVIATEARAAIETRGRFVLALSGGRTPAAMLEALSLEDVPWQHVHIVQVDERVAPMGHVDRNLTGLVRHLLARDSVGAAQVHPMPVDLPDSAVAVAHYVHTLNAVAGVPPVIDLVHLGLGPDGHTASLIPDDPALHVCDEDVALTGLYQGRGRMTMTLPLLNRARSILWVVVGADRGPMLARLLSGDASIPAGRVNAANARVIADRAAGRAGVL